MPEFRWPFTGCSNLETAAVKEVLVWQLCCCSIRLHSLRRCEHSDAAHTHTCRHSDAQTWEHSSSAHQCVNNIMISDMRAQQHCLWWHEHSNAAHSHVNTPDTVDMCEQWCWSRTCEHCETAHRCVNTAMLLKDDWTHFNTSDTLVQCWIHSQVVSKTVSTGFLFSHIILVHFFFLLCQDCCSKSLSKENGETSLKAKSVNLFPFHDDVTNSVSLPACWDWDWSPQPSRTPSHCISLGDLCRLWQASTDKKWEAAETISMYYMIIHRSGIPSPSISSIDGMPSSLKTKKIDQLFFFSHIRIMVRVIQQMTWTTEQ